MNRQIAQAIAVAAIAALCADFASMAIIINSRINLNQLAFGTLLALLLTSAVLAAAAWLSGLMLAARERRWDWLIGVLVLGPVGSLLLCLTLRHEGKILAS